ncbi:MULTISPECIES: hypothetical protein [unclassified Streptomyces]|uniref:hypothetical protein n=1 Tax=unclassified Streptomyces TaxID=2593676 RepID=UPI0033C3CCBA
MSTLVDINDWATSHLDLAAASAGGAAVLAGIVAVRTWRAQKSQTLPGATEQVTQARKRHKFSAGTLAAALAFVICTSVSLNTSFRFTGDAQGLAMTAMPERLLSCAAFESLLAMCVLGARERLADPEKRSPGWYGGAVWAFAALSAVPAWQEGDGLTTATAVRIIIGSFGSALAAHSALGLEMRHRSGHDSQAPLAQITRSIRERLMARWGLAQLDRTAQEIAQDRALDRAVDLADRYQRLDDTTKRERQGLKIARDLAKAQDRACVGTDAAQTELYRARVAQRKFATELTITDAESPWLIPGPTEETVRPLEAAAAQAEWALAAQIGTVVPGPRAEAHADVDEDSAECVEDEPVEEGRAAAAHGDTPVRVTARVSVSDSAEEAEDETVEDAMPEQLSADLASYETKAAAAQALYRVRIHDDGTRTTNAVAEELTERFQDWFGQPYDRGAANKVIKRLRPSTPVQRELTHV